MTESNVESLYQQLEDAVKFIMFIMMNEDMKEITITEEKLRSLNMEDYMIVHEFEQSTFTHTYKLVHKTESNN